MPDTDAGNAPPCHLRGLSVLVTRPEHQAEPICELIAAAHGRPVRFPALEILGPADKNGAKATLDGARRADLLVFVSANAVQYAFPLLPDQLPLDIAVAAIGEATARALDNVGLPATLTPSRMDSEGMLALPELQAIRGQRAFILRGNGGRELLAETLHERGAEVIQVEVYRRQLPQRVAGVRNLLDNWPQLVDVVIATSATILDNLFALLGDAGTARLRETPLIVVSQRLATHALTRGCQTVRVAASARDADMLGALCALAEDVA
jgi:uroporphyrinogen-III synthase